MSFSTVISLVEMIPLLGKVFIFFYGLCLASKKDVRLASNLSRPIMIIGSSKRDMKLETQLLKDAGFFRIEDPASELQNADRLRRHSMILVGYTKGQTRIKDLLEYTRPKNIPLVIVASPGEIVGKDLEAIKKYSFCEISNSNLRLVNLIFSILSTHKYEN